MTARGVVLVWARRLDGGHARSKRGSRKVVVGTHNERGAQTMAEQALGVVGKHPLNLDSGIPAIGQQQLERAFASRQQIPIGRGGRGLAASSLTAAFIMLSFQRGSAPASPPRSQEGPARIRRRVETVAGCSTAGASVASG